MISSKHNVKAVLNISIPMPMGMCMCMCNSMSGAVALRGSMFIS